MSASDNSPPETDLKKNPPVKRYGTPRNVPDFVKAREQAWGMLLEQVAQKLIRRNFTASIACSIKDAAELVMQRLLPDLIAERSVKTVSFGGSMTVREAGLLEAMKARPDLTVLDTFDMSIGLETMLELRRQALLADLFLCSVNALTRDGTLMLIDGFGNRTAAVQYGPRHVILLVGRNKICTSVEAGYDRIKGLAAPANVLRLNRQTPCAKTGYCMDCNSPERLCNNWAILPRCGLKDRIHVVLIDEETGF